MLTVRDFRRRKG